MIDRFGGPEHRYSLKLQIAQALGRSMIARLILILLVTALCGLGSAHADDFREAEILYTNEDYKAAFKAFEALAEKGHVPSQRFLASMYLSGKGVETDQVLARKWALLAAESGDAEAQHIMGLTYGKGTDSDLDIAREWYEKSSSQGFVPATESMVTFYLYQKKDRKKAVEWARKAARFGGMSAQLNLGKMLFDGKGVKESPVLGMIWIRRSAYQGYAHGMSHYARKLDDRTDGPGDAIRAVMFNGFGNSSGGKSWLKTSLSEEQEPRVIALGTVFLNRYRFDRTMDPAVQQVAYSRMRLDYPNYLQKVEPLAEAGNISAQLSLSRTLQRGWGSRSDTDIETDPEMAEYWRAQAIRQLEQQAAQGSREAKLRLASFRRYEQNSGSTNIKEAEKEIRKLRVQLATEGHPASLISIGVGTVQNHFDHSYSFRNDTSYAVDLTRQAAELGEPQAQFAMGKRYHQGSVVEQDLAQAHFWITLSGFIDYLPMLEEQMSEEDKARARALAEEWHDSKGGMEKSKPEWFDWLRDGIQAYDDGIFEMAQLQLEPLAERGFPQAQRLMGLMFRDGQGVRQSNHRAWSWLSKAAAESDAEAAAILKTLPEGSDRIPDEINPDLVFAAPAYESAKDAFAKKDLKAAHRLLQPRVDEGDIDAILAQATMYRNGLGVEQDIAKAGNLFRRAYEAVSALDTENDAEAAYKLGQFYEFGLVVEQDMEKAYALQARALSLGHFWGGCDPGSWPLKDGPLLSDKSGKTSESWRLFAVERGDPDAMYFLAQLYRDGRPGVPKNLERSYELYRQAAERGHLYSISNLGSYLFNEAVTSEERVEASKWASIAAKIGSAGGQTLQENLESQLTVEEILESRRLADDWLAKHDGFPAMKGGQFLIEETCPRNAVRNSALAAAATRKPRGLGPYELNQLNTPLAHDRQELPIGTLAFKSGVRLVDLSTPADERALKEQVLTKMRALQQLDPAVDTKSSSDHSAESLVEYDVASNPSDITLKRICEDYKKYTALPNLIATTSEPHKLTVLISNRPTGETEECTLRYTPGLTPREQSNEKEETAKQPKTDNKGFEGFEDLVDDAPPPRFLRMDLGRLGVAHFEHLYNARLAGVSDRVLRFWLILPADVNTPSKVEKALQIAAAQLLRLQEFSEDIVAFNLLRSTLGNRDLESAGLPVLARLTSDGKFVLAETPSLNYFAIESGTGPQEVLSVDITAHVGPLARHLEGMDENETLVAALDDAVIDSLKQDMLASALPIFQSFGEQAADAFEVDLVKVYFVSRTRQSKQEIRVPVVFIRGADGWGVSQGLRPEIVYK